MSEQLDPEELQAFAARLARESGQLILSQFGKQIAVERKADNSPVTIADRQAEDLMRRIIAQRFPDHQVLGEEGGLSGPDEAVYQWVLDPIDGTKSFIHAVPLFGTLIALLENGSPLLGAIHLPVSGELVVGLSGCPTLLNGKAVRVSSTTKLSEATFAYTDTVDLLALGHWEGFMTLQDKVLLSRGWGDCYGHFMVATGRADIMLDPILNLWDVAALKPCVEGAGGCLSDLEGNRQGLGKNALSTNGHLHQEVLALLKKHRR